MHDLERLRSRGLPAHLVRHQGVGEEEVSGLDAIRLPSTAEVSFLHNRNPGQNPDDQRLWDRWDDDVVLNLTARKYLDQQILPWMTRTCGYERAGEMPFERFSRRPIRPDHCSSRP